MLSINKYLKLSLAIPLLAAVLVWATPAFADINPPGCTANDFVVNLNKSTNTAYDETSPNGATLITYSVDAGNPQDIGGHGCNVDGVNISVTDPHGVSHVIQTGGSYPIGTAVTTLGTTVSYTAASVDEVSNSLSASVHDTGALHDKEDGTDPLDSSKTVSVTVIHPNTTVAITPSATAVGAGGTVDLTVTEQNTGNNTLTSPQVTLTPPGTILTKVSGTFTGGDTNSDSKLNPTETWTWLVTGVVVNANTTYTAIGDGIDSLGNHVTFSAYPNERATTTVNVVNAKISITPDGTNEINHKHTFTGHVEVDTGSGFGNAPNGTVISFASASGPGTFDTPTCTTAGGTGSCTDGLTSATPGVTVVNATTDVTVSTVLLHRTTNGSAGNSGPATKTWVDANIQISPLQDTDPVNDQHVLTGHVNVNTGTGGYVSAPDGTTIHFSIASGPGSLTPVSGDCTTGSGTGSCTVSLTSPTVGTTVINATTDVTVGGIILHRTTDGIGSNSGSAHKDWVKTTLTTTASAPVSVGGSIHDTAHLSGGANPVTGTISFDVFAPGDITCATPLAPAPTGATVSGNGDYNSGNFTANTAGTYRWIAHYSGDGTNPPASTACNDEGESVVVNPAQPSITTLLSATTGGVGAVVHDSATLHNQTANAGGTVAYNVYTDSACTLNGQSAGSNKTVTNGVVQDSDPITFNNTGDFYWQATYSGDTNNTGPVKSVCTEEHLVISQNHPTIATTLSATSVNTGTAVHDSSALTGATSDAGGTVTYTVYTNNQCTTGAQSAGTKTVTNGVVLDSDPITFNTAGTFYWQATYSGDAKNLGPVSSACQSEVLTVNQPAGQYCSPGYWKQTQHFHSYVTYHPTDLFDTVFESPTFPGKTLLEVLWQGGGGLNSLGRATVGALLNASALSSGLTPAQVISMFNAVHPGTNSQYEALKAQFTAPENCPLN